MLISLLNFSTNALKLNLEGVTHEESLLQPAGGNCINWLVGHILVHRNVMLRLTGELPIWSEEGEHRYARGSAPILGDDSDVERLETLVEKLEQTRSLLEPALAALTPIALAQPSDSRTVGQDLLFLGFHEGYHVGQIGVLRRVVGKEGAIA